MALKFSLTPVSIADQESGLWIRAVMGACNVYDFNGAQIEFFHINDWVKVRVASRESIQKVYLFLIDLDSEDVVLLEKFE